MKLPTVLRLCEDCRHALALVDGSTLVCARLGKLHNVTCCNIKEVDDDVHPGDVPGDSDSRPAPDGLERP